MATLGQVLFPVLYYLILTIYHFWIGTPSCLRKPDSCMQLLHPKRKGRIEKLFSTSPGKHHT